MDLDELVRQMHIMELTATTRSAAVLELVRAGHWEKEGISVASVVEAIETREAAAQTVIAPDIALPHATILWDGNYQLVLGRSREGVQYGAAGDIVRLIVLLVVGERGQDAHLQILTGIADLLKSDELRHSLIQAGDSTEIAQLLRQRAARYPADRERIVEQIPQLNVVLVSHAAELAKSLNSQALLLAVDRSSRVPWESLAAWAGRLLVVTCDSSEAPHIARRDTHFFKIPDTALSRLDRANLGLLLAAAEGLVNDVAEVVCVTGAPGQQLDSITITKPRAHFRAMFAGHTVTGSHVISPAVILRVLSLALELGSEGREGQPIGTMFVMGDAHAVQRHAQQLVLNPFYGIPRRLRNVLDPSLSETIKEFSLIDGAFVIDNDGTTLAAGTYLIPDSRVSDLPGGLGTRHQAAAAVTADTRAMAITVSQSTGTVSVFHDGKIVLSLERAAITRW